MAKKPHTIDDLLKAPRETLKLVTTKDKLAHPNLFSPGGSYLILKSTKRITSKIVYTTKSRWKDMTVGVSHSTAALQRKLGLRGYKTAASEAQAKEAKKSWLLKSAAKKLKKILKGGNDKQIRYTATDHMKDMFIRLRREKLNGKFLADGDWHQMIDIARAVNDPMLTVLMKY